MIEYRECIIYEIVGRKVGSSIQGHKRPRGQLRNGETYRVLQTIPPNTLTVRECWEHEQDWAVTLGYAPETQNGLHLCERTRSKEYTTKHTREAATSKTDYLVAGAKQSKTKSSEDWWNKIGKDAYERAMNKVDFEERGRSIASTINSNEWINQNHKLCPVCGKGPMNPGAYATHIKKHQKVK
jgi:hypothetical protein